MIEVQYTCHGCGIVRAKVLVRERRSDEDVVLWTTNVMAFAVSIDHHRRSPACMKREADILIPTTGRNYIGGPIVQ